MASWMSRSDLLTRSRSNMGPFEIEEILHSFRIVVDTREQDTPKARERYKAFEVPIERATLRYGDYCANITLPTGDLYSVSSVIFPACCVERKMSLDELASCFTRSRDRFQREFSRAAENGARIYLLVEGGSWEAIDQHRYRSRFNPAAFRASLTSWMIRYQLTPIFCKAGTSGRMIKEILYRDIKERLETGEFG